MKAKPKLTAEYVRECLAYDAETGVLTWKQRPRSHFKNKQAWSAQKTNFAGTVAGSDTGIGYLSVVIDAQRYGSHRLAHLIMTGNWPEAEIDHVNGVRNDNRWANLRAVTKAQNHQNKRTPLNNTSGFRGVVWSKQRCKWVAQIKLAGKTIHLGIHKTIESARSARIAAEAELHPYSTRPEVLLLRSSTSIGAAQ